MDFDLKEYFPSPRDWFQSQLSFEGHAAATFSVPAGEIRGVGRMSAPSSKTAFLEISVTELIAPTEYDIGFNLISFLGSEIPVREGNVITFRRQRDQNPCETVTLCTLEGIFFSQDIGVYGYHTEDGRLVLSLFPRDFTFQRWGAKGQPTYWVAPLTNLFTKFPIAPDNLRTHPLRLKALREVEQGSDRTEWQWKWLAANQANQLFAFQTDTDSFFIEPLAGYENGEQGDRSSSIQVTAVAVGDLKGRSLSSHKEIIQWFPFDILAPLSFGTGSEVGIPWFETRNERGELLTRLHVSIGHAGKTKGDSVFTAHHLGQGSGLGEFVSRYLSLSPEGRRALAAPMNLFLKGTPGSGHVEENLVDIIRALENLAGQHGLTRINLGASLTNQNRSALDIVVNNARHELSQLRRSNQQVVAFDQTRILDRIISRLANVATSENDFGLAVVELSKRHGFPDPDILDADYIPRIHGRKTWASLLSELRGATIHEGRIEFEKRHDISEVFKLLRHLHDLLARIIFKECGYTGTYQTQLIGFTNAESVDWVKPGFDAVKLRF
jgi:hypothetical protein